MSRSAIFNIMLLILALSSIRMPGLAQAGEPDSAELSRQGQALINQGQYRKARDTLTKAIGLDGKSSEAFRWPGGAAATSTARASGAGGARSTNRIEVRGTWRLARSG